MGGKKRGRRRATKRVRRVRRVRMPTAIRLRRWDSIFERYDWDEIKVMVLRYLRRRFPSYKWSFVVPWKIYKINGEYVHGRDIMCSDDFAIDYIGVKRGSPHVIVAHFCMDCGTIYLGRDKCPSLDG